ncbi:uncharacterized protein [Diadema setosum]|uniref:uncharacterized protein n=1 Tax=Diadema setosum TaxID=31175 RepID=UPI003B3B5645
MSFMSPEIPIPASGSCEDADLVAEPCSENGVCYTVDANVPLDHPTLGNVMVRLRQKGCSESEMPKNTCEGPSSAAYQQVLSELQGNLAQSTAGFEPLVGGQATGGICTCDTGDHCNANLMAEADGVTGSGSEQNQTPAPSVSGGNVIRCSACSDLRSSSSAIPLPTQVCERTDLQSIECANGCMNTTVTVTMSSQQQSIGGFTLTQVVRGCAEPDTEENTCYGPGDPRFDTVSGALEAGMSGTFPTDQFTVEGISGGICTCDTLDNCNFGPVVPQPGTPTPEPHEPNAEPGAEPEPEPEYSGDGILHCSECNELTSSHPSIPLPGGNCGGSGQMVQDCTLVGSCGNMTVTILVYHEAFGEMTITQRTRGCAEPLLSERNVCYGPGDAPFDAITAAAQESFGLTLTSAGLSYRGISGSMCSCDTGDYCNFAPDQTSPAEPVVAPTSPPDENNALSGSITALKPRPSSVEERGLVQFFRGWADVQGQGAPNDYCRVVRTDGKPFLSCHLAGSEGQDVMAYTSPNPSVEWFDPGYSNTWYMKDEDGDGRDDYCRCVGSVPNTIVVCMKAGMNGFEGPDQEFTPAGAPRDCFYLTADPFFGFP